MSAYYYAESSGAGPIKSLLSHIELFPFKQLLFFLRELDAKTPMRTWFVGTLFVLGVFLYLYKGFSWRENYLLNAAGLFSLGVALFPMGWDCGDKCPSWTFHGICAFLAFFCLALVAVFCAKETLSLPGLTPQKEASYRHWYTLIGWAMVVLPTIAIVLTWLFGQSSYDVFAYGIFASELLGLWAFAAYWFIKSQELAETRADQHAAAQNLVVTRDAPKPALPGLPVPLPSYSAKTLR